MSPPLQPHPSLVFRPKPAAAPPKTQFLSLPHRTKPLQRGGASEGPSSIDRTSDLAAVSVIEQANPPARLTNLNKTKPTTECFESVHLAKHAYHHQLECGHEIFTKTRQPCGGNCALKEGTSIKARGGRFARPVPACARRLRDGLKEELTVFRTTTSLQQCKLSGATGNLREDTDIRLEEAKIATDAGTNQTSRFVQAGLTRQQATAVLHDRSLSPGARATKIARYKALREARDAGREVREHNRATALFSMTKIDAISAGSASYPCDYCMRVISGSRYTCDHCGLYDLCRECFNEESVVPQHQCDGITTDDMDMS